ncbi:hypothetical protein FA95DRAFT_1501607 [Auriscalpium vulgare]|uniref:Uncharacterized protein n=1 Tax=Auriscalpium vulgare TaxID=40419 RepID=A0ACB8RB27_9AGAM|nr:hypothetical protein FA95DRAFT_1501607 [Auriscalpium vulgare]
MSLESFTSSEHARHYRANPGTLDRSERWWQKRQKVLEELGYVLRPRYREGWTPSWKGTKKDYHYCEDGQEGYYTTIVIDATRVSDQKHVAMKRIMPPLGENELSVLQHLATEPLRSDPRNRCVPLLDVLELPDGEKLVVLPLLHPWDTPRFKTVGEVVAFFDQILNAVHFLHDNNLAHRDCCHNNIMYDPTPMYPIPAHPLELSRRRDWKGRVLHYSRTQRPPTYFLIDFDLALIFNPANGPPLAEKLPGGDKSAPEHRDLSGPCDPFPTDVYYLGNLMRRSFVQRYGFKFLEPLLADMCCDDPSKRLTIGEAVARFKDIRANLSAWKLRSRVVSRKDHAIVGFFRGLGHLYSTVRDIRKAPIPDP